jgi:hypothetical protein
MAMLSCSRSLVYEMITRGDIAAIKIASATRITDASVKKLLATARKGLSDPIIPEEHRHKQKGRRKVARLVKPNATDARRTTWWQSSASAHRRRSCIRSLM